MSASMTRLHEDIRACTLCHGRFAATVTGHAPRPVVWFREGARILVAGQAPGAKVHASGKPFTDPSGDRLRDWMGIDEAQFYDRSRIAIVPQAFCFPGYNAKGSDLPPPKICAETWADRVMSAIEAVKLKLIIGGYAHKRYLPEQAGGGVTKTVAGWSQTAPDLFPLPHPSWRNNAWIKKNPWFETDLLPSLRNAVAKALA